MPHQILYKVSKVLCFCEFLICYCIFSREPHSIIFIFVRWTFVSRLCGIGSVFEKSVYSIVFLIKYRSENHINTPEKQSSKEKCSLGFIRQTPVLTADVQAKRYGNNTRSSYPEEFSVAIHFLPLIFRWSHKCF